MRSQWGGLALSRRVYFFVLGGNPKKKSCDKARAVHSQTYSGYSVLNGLTNFLSLIYFQLDIQKLVYVSQYTNNRIPFNWLVLLGVFQETWPQFCHILP